MTEKIMTEVISRRRALSFLGLAAISLAVPATVMIGSDAEAQQPSPPAQKPTTNAPTTDAPKTKQTGTERRQARRTRRVKRRTARKTGRSQRRQVRRTGTKDKA
jgi:hypothetical protein